MLLHRRSPSTTSQFPPLEMILLRQRPFRLCSAHRPQMDEARRRDKLDDALLFLTASVGILFSILQVYLRPSTLLQFLIPVGLIALVVPIFFGYVKGAVQDSMVNRYRGWV